MDNFARYVRLVLKAAPIVAGAPKPAFPGFMPFDEPRRPTWWNDDLAPKEWGMVLGVNESEPGTSDGAIVIAKNGLAVFTRASAPTWVPYRAIDRWDQLSKEPVSTSLFVRTKANERIELPFKDGGAAFTFVQFLISAIREDRIRRSE
jgi:hypothetical protein